MIDNPLIKTLQESDEALDKNFSEWEILNGQRKNLKSFNHSRSLKLLEAVAQEYRMMPYLDFGEVIDEAINLYRK